MAIVLTTPSTNLQRRFEFEVTRDDQIQISKIVESLNPAEHYTLNNPFHYRLEAIRDLYLWLRNENNNGWVLLATRNEYIGENDPQLIFGSVEAWARPPINDWYGITPGLRGRFATFIPPILEYLGLAEVEHNPQNNRMRAL